LTSETGVIQYTAPKTSLLHPMLLSLETIKFLYEAMRGVNAVPELSTIVTRLCNQKELKVESVKYSLRDLYVSMIDIVKINSEQIFTSK
jgi:hypothetical protein